MQVFLKPVVSEKSMHQGGQGKFTFVVPGDMDKQTIKREVEKQFKVNVTHISTAWVKGRGRRSGPRREEKILSPWKKAIVTVKEGQKIDIFDIV